MEEAQKRKTTSDRDGDSNKKKKLKGPSILVSSTAAAVGYSAVNEDIHSNHLLAEAVDFPKQDPLTVLNEEVCLEIFSFLCPTPETETCDSTYESTITDLTTAEWLQSKAGKLYSQLGSVSKLWKATFDRIVDWSNWVGKVGMHQYLDFDPDNAQRVVSMINWLCSNKIQLGAVSVQGVGLGDLPLLKKLIKECQTEELRLVCVSFENLQDISHSFLSLNCGPIHTATQKSFQDTVAQSCPNLEFLGLTLMLPKATPIYTPYINQHLFSSPSIKVLNLDVRFFDEDGTVVDPKWGTSTPIEGRVYTDLIKNLPNLKKLILLSMGNVEVLKNRRFELESPTLEVLNIMKLSHGAVLSVDCPSLKALTCDAGPDGNSCLIRQVPLRVSQQIFANQPDDTPLVAPVHLMGSVNLQVPQDCKIVLYNFCQWGEGNKTYADYTKHVNDFPNPIYQTFG